MHSSFRLRMIANYIAEAALLFRHQSRELENDYEEVAHLWPDQRGHAFVRTHLLPLLQEFPSVVAALSEAARVSEAAVLAAAEAEAAIAQVDTAASDNQGPAGASLRQVINAEELTALSGERARSCQMRAGNLSARVVAIGAPPI